ncbi:MAG: porin [Proteobacteria bacterium]|nr:porin [Pseudomonadota bacterium]
MRIKSFLISLAAGISLVIGFALCCPVAQAGEFVTRIADKVEFSGFARFITGFSDNLPDDMHNIISDSSRHDTSFITSAGFSRLRFTITGPEVEGWKTRGFVDGDFRGSGGDGAKLRMRQAWVGIKDPNDHWDIYFGQKESILDSMISYKYTLSLEGLIGAGTLYQRSPGMQIFRHFGPYHIAAEVMKASDAGPGTGKLNENYSDQPSCTVRTGYKDDALEGWLAFRYDDSEESYEPDKLGQDTNNAGWLLTGEGEWQIHPFALYATGYIGEGSAYPHIFRTFDDDGGPLSGLTMINSNKDETWGAMLGARVTIDKFAFAASFGLAEVEDGDNSWAAIVGRDTRGESLKETTVRGNAKYNWNPALWFGLEYVHSELSGMPEADNYKGDSCLLHVNYSF